MTLSASTQPRAALAGRARMRLRVLTARPASPARADRPPGVPGSRARKAATAQPQVRRRPAAQAARAVAAPFTRPGRWPSAAARLTPTWARAARAARAVPARPARAGALPDLGPREHRVALAGMVHQEGLVAAAGLGAPGRQAAPAAPAPVEPSTAPVLRRSIQAVSGAITL